MPAVRLDPMLRTSRLERDGRSFVVASYAGEDRDPPWATNLRLRPEGP